MSTPPTLNLNMPTQPINITGSSLALKGGGYADTNPAVYGSNGKKIYFNAYPNYPGFDAQAGVLNIYGDTTGIQFWAMMAAFKGISRVTISK